MVSRRTLLIFAILLAAALVVSAHDLFLKLDSYFLQPNSQVTVHLLNGTFTNSDGPVARDRFRDVRLVANGVSKSGVENFSWRDEAKTTGMQFQTSTPGTYLVGASTKPREIDLKAADFNDYLQHDGLPDTLAERRRDKELNKDVRERYSKHVRAIFQVGDKLSDDYKNPLGYPVEIIPQQNPYSLKAGQTVTVLCTLAGEPLVNQFVLAGWQAPDQKLHSVATRTDRNGLASFKLTHTGKWYVKLIHMTPLADPQLNYESRWATLTFEIRK
jgi:uncharacterized GH25 family protein